MAVKGKKVRITTRERKKYRIRKRMIGTEERPRLSVFRSNKHIYAQIVSDVKGAVIASASTLQPDVVAEIERLAKVAASEAEAVKVPQTKKSVLAAKAVGVLVARRGKEKNVQKVVFDRNGYLFHGRIKAVADGAREGGLEF